MGATYTRQSSSNIVDGNVIEASDINNEFDQLLAAFAVTTGHTHDGTAAEGGPIAKLLSNTLTFGAGTAGTDITITFDGETADGVMKWMEDEDYFEFSDDILVASTEKIQFRDTAIYINSSADGQLDLVADTEIQIAATTIDINGNVDISGTLTVAGALDFGDAALSNVGALQLDSIAGDADTNTSITFSGSDVITIATGGSNRLTIGDGALSPSTDNEIDLGTSSLEFKDAFFDGTVTSDAFAGPLTGDVTGNVSGTAATVTTAAQSNITSLGTLTTLTVDNVIVNGTTIGHTSDTDLMTLTSGVLTVAGEVDATSLDVSGDADIDGTLEADAITIDGVTLAETIADTVGAMVSSNTESGITVAYQDADNTLDFTVGTLNQDTTGTAAIATTVTITDNESTNESNAIIFTAGGDVDGGNLGLESDGTLTYNPSTGKITATGFIGTLTGDVTGNTSGTAATVTTAAQSNITSLGTLTTLTVDNVIINGATIGHTDDTDLITVADGIATVAGEISVTTLDIGGTNVTSTATELNLLDGVSGLVQADLTKLAAIDATAAEINLIDGGTARGTDALADGDGILINDGGVMKMTNVTAVKTYMAGSAATAGFALAMAVAL
jgi:hypothetical protein